MQDFVNQIVLRLPNWLRWLLIVPVAIVADLLSQSFFRMLFLALPEPFRPFTDELIWRFFAPMAFVAAGLKMAPKHWFIAACCLIGFKALVAIVNVYTLVMYVSDGGSLRAPAYATDAPVWWSLLVQILFLAFAVFVVAKDMNIRKIPTENVPIFNF